MLTPTTLKTACLALIVTGLPLLLAPNSAEASYGHRQYYSSWSYHPQNHYYYSSYYYRPTVTVTTYTYHYCIYRPSTPRYVYYYNPSRNVYWGRYDLEEKGYSMLAEKDRKGSLDDIPESAFPEPSKMPEIPDAKDGERIKPIDIDLIPGVSEPDSLPAN